MHLIANFFNRSTHEKFDVRPEPHFVGSLGVGDGGGGQVLGTALLATRPHFWGETRDKNGTKNPKLGCESKIDSTIPTYSIFLDTYDVYRKDRTLTRGSIYCYAQ